MKIKEVIGKTGLTDKAIRLYINEGLAVPNIEENYSGRKSIEFSDEDIERLNNVAMLRKAGFSIADIKSIVDKKEIKEIIEKYIGETQAEIGYKTEIVEKLKNISFDEEVTLETICNTLSATVEETEVPSEDLRKSFWERFTQKIYILFSIVSIVLSDAAIIFYYLVFKDMFIHLYLADGGLNPVLMYYGGWIIVSVLAVIMLLLNLAKQKKPKSKKRTIVSFALVLIIVAVSICVSISSVLGVIFVSPVLYSLTTNPEDYLVLDKYVAEEFGEEIREVFPETIPLSAVKYIEKEFDNSGYPFTTEYFYRHTWVLDPDFDIVAEWVLSEEEYAKAKNTIKKNPKEVKAKGDWVCNYYADTSEQHDSWNDEHYWILIFAFNDKSQKVRYVASYAIDSYPDGPYYLTLDWE